VNRHFASVEASDLVGVNVDTPSFAAQLGEADSGAKTDVAGADYSNCFTGR